MKKLIITIILLTSGRCYSQEINLPIDSVTHKITWSEVVKVDSTTANDLFQKAKYWITKTYVSSKAVIDDKDNSSFQIIGSGAMQGHCTIMGMAKPWGYINYTIMIICKDGRYKYTFSNFVHTFEEGRAIGEMEKTESPSGIRQKDLDRLKDQLYQNMTSTVASLKSAMKEKINNEW